MNRTSLAIMVILISALTIDTVISIVYDLISKQVDSSWGVIFFIVISAIILVVGQVLLLTDIKKRTEYLRTSNSIFNKLYKLTVAVQYFLIALFIFMAIQLVLTSGFEISLGAFNFLIQYLYLILTTFFI